MRRRADVAPKGARSYGIVDSDVDLHDPRQRAETSPHEWRLLAAIAVGGVLGAEARYGLDLAIPHPLGAFAWSTLLTNVIGCLLIGVLMVVLTEVVTPHRLARPFLGTGVLGGFTTFSTFAVDTHRLLVEHRLLVALGYGALSLAGCLVAVAAGVLLSRRLLVGRRPAGVRG